MKAVNIKIKENYLNLSLISIFIFSSHLLMSQNKSHFEDINHMSNIDAIANGKKLFKLELFNVDGELVNINKIESDYLLIYIWSTYCRPCLQTLSKSKKLVTEFENVEFVFISIDELKSRWEKLVKQKKYKGIHLYTNESNKPPISYLIYRMEYENNKLIKYQGGVPTILLIDRNKNIIENNVPQYSTEAIIDFFKNHTS